MVEHTSELDYDLMTRTGRSLDEWIEGGAAGIVALSRFIKCLPLDSKTACALSGYEHMDEWHERMKTNMLLADVYDNLSAFRYLFATSKSKKKGKRPEPYPRPWKKKTKHFGKGAIKVKDFWAWWDSENKKKGR